MNYHKKIGYLISDFNIYTKKNKNMLIVEIKKGETIEIALKKFKNKFKRTKVTEQLKDNLYYDKPSIKKRESKKRQCQKF